MQLLGNTFKNGLRIGRKLWIIISTHVFVIDSSKAFDSIPYGYLIKLLESYGLSEGAVKLLSSFYQNRMQETNGNKYST